MKHPRYTPMLLAIALGLPVAAGEENADENTVAAHVGDVPIYVKAVRRTVEAGLGGRKVEPAARPRLEAHALVQLIDRELVLRELRARKIAAGPDEIAVELQRVRQKLKSQNLTLEEFLQRSGQSEAEFERELAWKLSWDYYVERNVTDQTLARYFAANRKEFDGTMLRVSHLLLRPKSPRTAAGDAAAVATASQLRRQILEGELTFADAARRHSASPTKDQGGDLGFIQRRGSMGEAFSRSAFALKKGEISEPVVSPFGVHLINCTEEKPGEKKWTDVREELRPALSHYLFAWLADRQRPQTTVRFSGTSPHFKPGTTELVVPRR